MSNAFIFIVSTGERCEGSTVKGVFTSYDKAVNFALSIETSFGNWQKPDASQGEHFYVDVHDNTETTIWWCGCDFVEVVKHPVK